MGNQNTHHAVELDDDLLTRAGDLLKEAHARKRSRDEELAAPAPMFSMPKPALPDVGAAVGDEYTSAVLAAATAYVNSGGKACKPIEAASAGSIGRKAMGAYEPSDSSVATQSTPSPRASVAPPPPPTAAAGDAVIGRNTSSRTVVYKCRRCGCNKRSHVCVETPAHAGAPATAADQRLRPWTVAEDEVICSGVKEHGYKWSLISTRLEGRTDNAVRNRWHRLEAARKWRQEMNARQQQSADVPGYKCGRCGQPKRGHVCPYGADAPRGAARPTVAPRADDISDVVSDAELAELFASLEACPAADAGEGEDGGELDAADMCGLVEAIVNAQELEEILSSAEPSSIAAADFLSAAAYDSSTAGTPPVAADWDASAPLVDESDAWFVSSSGLDDEALMSAEGAVSF